VTTATPPPVQTTPAPSGDLPALLDVKQVASLLGCSERHVYRLNDTGRMPAKAKLGALARWPRQAILDWIAAGCPSRPQ
jgi:excisionase family DNA binding protein